LLKVNAVIARLTGQTRVTSGKVSGVDPKLLHPRQQRGAVDAHTSSGTIRAAYPAFGSYERSLDLFALLLLEFACRLFLGIESADRFLHDPRNIVRRCGGSGWLLCAPLP